METQCAIREVLIQGNIIEAYSLKDYQKVDDLIL